MARVGSMQSPSIVAVQSGGYTTCIAATIAYWGRELRVNCSVGQTVYARNPAAQLLRKPEETTPKALRFDGILIKTAGDPLTDKDDFRAGLIHQVHLWTPALTRAPASQA